MPAPSPSADLHHHLAEVFAGEELVQRLDELVDAGLDHVLFRLQLALGHPAGHGRDRLAVALGVVKHHEALHAGAVDEQAHVVGRSADGRGIVLADGAADTDAAVEGDLGQADVQDLAADVVEIDIDAVGRELAQAFGHVLALVVDAGVEAEFVDHKGALADAAGDADSPPALDLGQLTNDRAHGAGCARDYDRVPRLHGADVEQPEVGGHARHAEAAEVALQRHAAGLDLLQLPALHDGVFLHTGDSGDLVAGAKGRVVRFQHLPRAAGAHHLAQFDRRDVASARVHPAAHGRVERQVRYLHQHFALSERRDLDGLEREILTLGIADRPGGELDLTVLKLSHGAPSCQRYGSL